MSEEEIKELCDDLDKRIILHQAINEPFNQDLDNLIKLSVAYEKLQQENQQLKQWKELHKSSALAEESIRVDKRNKLLASVLDKIKEKLDFAKATIEYDNDYDIGYNFLISAEKIKEILDKVKV